jgi:hypothetical protein
MFMEVDLSGFMFVGVMIGLGMISLGWMMFK